MEIVRTLINKHIEKTLHFCILDLSVKMILPLFSLTLKKLIKRGMKNKKVTIWTI